MRRRMTAAEAVLAAAVLIHLGVTVLHGAAHARAGVTLSPASMAFVFGVIVIGPLLGLIVQQAALPRAGAWITGVALAGALVFGVANHFLIDGADHVTHVAGPWRAWFGVTAALLAVLEALGSTAAVWCARRASVDTRG